MSEKAKRIWLKIKPDDKVAAKALADDCGISLSLLIKALLRYAVYKLTNGQIAEIVAEYKNRGE